METGFLRLGSGFEDARIEDKAEQEMIVAIVDQMQVERERLEMWLLGIFGNKRKMMDLVSKF